ncbi:hypothetical protein [Mycobacterium uberis]|uniref:hypothetical protein n=1 Tax=Mycobacterium uberis TaxID=2162698 RepID=UPI001FB41B7C|nr:hypothetical protein [Mycobacterium uberis]
MVSLPVGYVGATLVMVATLATAVEFGWLSVSIIRVSDVGISNDVVGALATAIPRRWRVAWIS